MLFRLKFNETLREVKKDIVSFTKACQEVRHSHKFAVLLKFILSVCNIVNAGSRNERSIGFEISFLPNLINTKLVDNQRTLLHLIVDHMEKFSPNELKFFEDFSFLDNAARGKLPKCFKTIFITLFFLANTENITRSLNYIKSSLTQLANVLSNFKPECSNDNYLKVMSSFKNSAQKEFDLLVGMNKSMEDSYKDLAIYLSFEPKKVSMDDFFQGMKSFKDQYVSAIADNMERQLLEEKKRRAMEAREKAEREKRDRIARNQAAKSIGTTNGEGLMDNLIQSLTSGQAFEQYKRKRTRVQTPQGKLCGRGDLE